MSISQETANLIDTLASAASKIGSTAASAKLNQAIVDLIPPSQTGELEAMVTILQGNIATLAAENEQLTIDANAYRISNDIRGENLEVLRGRMAEIAQIASAALADGGTADFEVIQNILTISAPMPDASAT